MRKLCNQNQNAKIFIINNLCNKLAINKALLINALYMKKLPQKFHKAL
jgi:hypothetical protein